MKIKKKAAMAAAVFAAAMNLTACAYGPPMESRDAPQSQEQPSDSAENQSIDAEGQNV
ncbi:MAG: hypothetical protein K2K41_04115 [Ruminiclostridium sp.]|nr:hypothetical protein [Ruminiclostridium sp.]